MTDMEQELQAVPHAEVNFFNPSKELLQVNLSGTWRLSDATMDPQVLDSYLKHHGDVQQLIFNTQHLIQWDSGLLRFVLGIIKVAEEHQLAVDDTGLPKPMLRLIKLSKITPSQTEVRKFVEHLPIIDYIGTKALALVSIGDQIVTFLGELYKSFARLFLHRARFTRRDILALLHDNGLSSVFMVILISFLIGGIFSFIEAVQLKIMGAQLLLANVMSIAIVRELAPMMTAIFMAGRTGAAYAANIGMMRLNDEVNALETTGISPYDFLVMPRLLALIFMMPLLYLYAMVAGILGSSSLDMQLLGFTMREYLHRVFDVIDLWDVLVGISKSLVFGFIVGFWGCFQGMRCGAKGIKVGDASRNAVVMGLISIIGADVILIMFFHALKL